VANEITIAASLAFLKGTAEEDLDLTPVRVTVSGVDYAKQRQSVGTSEELLLLGDVGTPGFIIGINRDATNYVEFLPTSGGVATVKAKAGEPFMFRFASAASAPYVKANTGACIIEYLLIED